MKLDEAIKHYEELVEEQEKAAKEWHENQVRKCKLIHGTKMDYTHENECKKCAEEHRQLAKWLRDYKRLLEQESSLDKVRAEVEAREMVAEHTIEYRFYNMALNDVLQIIDKYKSRIGGNEERR